MRSPTKLIVIFALLIAPATACNDDAGGDFADNSGSMILIPAGPFLMGCVPGDSACNGGEKPQHSVTLNAFYIDKTEVTAEAYKQCVDAGKCTAPKSPSSSCSPSFYGTFGNSSKTNHPVNCVDWNQALAYCKWTDGKGRLPTEAEWEKAARGGLSDKVYPWGDQAPTCTPSQSNTAVYYSDGSGCGKDSAWAVGTGSSANGYGLYDMAGNVWEWTADWYSSSYYGSSPASDPQGPSSGSDRVVRGGRFSSDAVNLRSSHRDLYGPSGAGYYLGFRCSRSYP